MNENEVISNTGELLHNHILSRVYFNVNRQILYHHKCIGKRILNAIIGLKLGNYIHFHDAIKLLNF